MEKCPLGCPSSRQNAIKCLMTFYTLVPHGIQQVPFLLFLPLTVKHPEFATVVSVSWVGCVCLMGMFGSTVVQLVAFLPLFFFFFLQVLRFHPPPKHIGSLSVLGSVLNLELVPRRHTMAAHCSSAVKYREHISLLRTLYNCTVCDNKDFLEMQTKCDNGLNSSYFFLSFSPSD